MRALVLAVVATVVPTAAFAEGPSFDCRTARTPREIAVCADASLAKADRDLTATYVALRRRLPAKVAESLTADQREFIADLDDGFGVEMWGRGGVPDEAERIRADVRTAVRGHHDSIGRLRAEIEARSRSFAGLVTDRPGFAGTWAMHGTTLTITADGGGWRLVYEHPSYGWPKYECHFTALARSTGPDLAVDGVDDTDIGERRGARLTLRREGAVLIVAEALQEEGGRSACVRAGPVDGTFFAVGR
jgi:hypothetical protein